MTAYVQNFIGGFGQFVALAAIAVVWMGLSAIGAAAGGRRRFREADFVSGWAVACLLFTLAGVFTPVRFTWLAGIMALAAVAATVRLWRSGSGPVPTPAVRMAALAAPLLMLVSAMAASQWDEFSHWLPSARFLLAADRFPDATSPVTGASFPAYPYGWPLITYLASLVAMRFLENVGPLVNVLLLLSFGLLCLRVIRHAGDQTSKTPVPGWGLCAVGGLLVTLLNPTFVQKVVLTGYADTPSAVALGFAVVLTWFMLDAQSKDDRGTALALAWQSGLALGVLVSLKQATLVLALLVLGSAAAIVWRDRAIGLRNGLHALAVMALPPFVLYLAWRYHVATELSGREFAVRPISSWAIGLLPQIVASMASVALSKGFYFGIMLIATGLAVRGWFRFKSPFDRLAVLAGILFVGYNAFLLFAYVAAFSEGEAVRAASYWRYNMHLGAVAVAFLAYALASLWHARVAEWIGGPNLAWIPIVLLLAAPFVLAHKVRFDRQPPVPHFRQVGTEVAALLPAGTRLVVVDPQGSGESAIITRYEGDGRFNADVFVSAFTHPDADNIRAALAAGPADHALIHSVTPAVREVFGHELAANASYLFHREPAGGWSLSHTWRRPENP